MKRLSILGMLLMLAVPAEAALRVPVCPPTWLQNATSSYVRWACLVQDPGAAARTSAAEAPAAAAKKPNPKAHKSTVAPDASGALTAPVGATNALAPGEGASRQKPRKLLQPQF